MSDEFRSFHDFLSRGLLPEAGPLQPPERPRLTLVPPVELTQAEKLDLVREMASHAEWRAAVMEAIPEADTYDWFLNAIIWGSDKEAGDWARERIVSYIEAVLKQRGESWRTYL
jgi:hypothetical protein